MSKQQISGWGEPEGALSSHFFLPRSGHALLEAVCSFYDFDPWYWDPAVPLDRGRELHEEGNCMGCRAWLSVPKNRRALAVVEV